MTNTIGNSKLTAIAGRTSSHGIAIVGFATGALLAFTLMITGCTTSTVAPPTPTVAVPAVGASVVAPLPPRTTPVVTAPTPAPDVPKPVAQPKEPPPVDLPEYAKRGRRLPANGGAPGRAIASYCRSFQIDKDAAAYFKTLKRTKRLPTAAEVAERSRQAGQTLTVQQVVERDWTLRRESNKSALQRCKVLGGSIDGATALVVFEADLNGLRQRGIATVTFADKKWRVRDHGDWVPVK